MFTRLLSLLLVIICVSPAAAAAQVEEPSGVILRGAVRDSTWTPDNVPVHVNRCRSRQMTQLILSPIGGYVAGVVAHAFTGPWEGSKPANHAETRRRWGFAGAALAFVLAAGEMATVDCAQQPLPERPPLRQPPRQRPW